MHCMVFMQENRFHFSNWLAQSSASHLFLTFAESIHMGSMVQNGNAQWLYPW